MKRLASDVEVPNCDSMYFGRKTTNPLTIQISQQIAGNMMVYTGFLIRASTALGISGHREKTTQTISGREGRGEEWGSY